MNYEKTIKKLHETFPEFDVETILKIMDCIKEDNVTYTYSTLEPKVLDPNYEYEYITTL